MDVAKKIITKLPLEELWSLTRVFESPATLFDGGVLFDNERLLSVGYESVAVAIFRQRACVWH